MEISLQCQVHFNYYAGIVAIAELLTVYASYKFLDSKKEMDAKAIELTKSTTASCLEEQTTIKSNGKI